jgi:hypothetical protein
MNSIFTFISELPTYYYYTGGVLLLIYIYQRYDENHRYNKKSGPAPEAPKPVMATKQEQKTTATKSATGVDIQLNQQMIDFLKNYDPTKSTWTTWAFKKFFPEEILEDLSDAAQQGELKVGTKMKIKDGDWEIVN